MSPVVDGRPDPARSHLRHADPVLANIIDKHPDFDPRAWLADLPPLDAFATLIFQVIGQQLSVAATRRILDRLQALFDGHLPTPAELLAIDPDQLRKTGLSRRKIGTLRTVAAQFADGTLSEGELRGLSDDQIQTRLTAIPGIGPWTVHGFLIIAFARPDVVLPGDLALRKAIQQAYGLEHLPSQDEVVRLAEPWRPYRSLASAYLFQNAFDPAIPSTGTTADTEI